MSIYLASCWGPWSLRLFYFLIVILEQIWTHICMWKTALGFECRFAVFLMSRFWQLKAFGCFIFMQDILTQPITSVQKMHVICRMIRGFISVSDCRWRLRCLWSARSCHAFCVDTSHRRRTDLPSMPIYTHTPFCAEIKGLSAERVAQWSGRQ